MEGSDDWYARPPGSSLSSSPQSPRPPVGAQWPGARGLAHRLRWHGYVFVTVHAQRLSSSLGRYGDAFACCFAVASDVCCATRMHGKQEELSFHASAAACGGPADMAALTFLAGRVTVDGRRRWAAPGTECQVLMQSHCSPGHACVLGVHLRVHSSCGHLLSLKSGITAKFNC